MLFAASAALFASGCVSLELNVARTPSTAYVGQPAAALTRLWDEQLAGQPGMSGFRLVADGLEAFALRAMLTRRAEHTLDIQYYIIHSDDTGKLLAHEVIAAADRGVRVRILLDDIYAAEADHAILALDSHPDIEIRLFNPWRRRSGAIGRVIDFLATAGRLNQRMHNKLFAADGVAAILGGRNLGDEYFVRDRDLDFRDLDVLAVGPVAREAGQSFDAYWNSEFAVPADAIQLRTARPTLDDVRRFVDEHAVTMREGRYVRAIDSSLLSREIATRHLIVEPAPGRIVADDPDKLRRDGNTGRPDLIAQMRAVMGEPQRELVISSPYFVPGREGVRMLAQYERQGVAVRVLTNSFAANDVPLVHVGYAKYRPALLRAGVELFELKRNTEVDIDRPSARRFGSANASLHAKAVGIDGRWLFVGSLNIDPRSIVKNTEIGVVIDSVELSNQAARMFDYTTQPEMSYQVKLAAGSRSRLEWHSMRDGQPVIEKIEPDAGWWRRLGFRLLRYVPFLEAQI